MRRLSNNGKFYETFLGELFPLINDISQFITLAKCRNFLKVTKSDINGAMSQAPDYTWLW